MRALTTLLVILLLAQTFNVYGGYLTYTSRGSGHMSTEKKGTTEATIYITNEHDSEVKLLLDDGGQTLLLSYLLNGVLPCITNQANSCDDGQALTFDPDSLEDYNKITEVSVYLLDESENASSEEVKYTWANGGGNVTIPAHKTVKIKCIGTQKTNVYEMNNVLTGHTDTLGIVKNTLALVAQVVSMCFGVTSGVMARKLAGRIKSHNQQMLDAIPMNTRVNIIDSDQSLNISSMVSRILNVPSFSSLGVGFNNVSGFVNDWLFGRFRFTMDAMIDVITNSDVEIIQTNNNNSIMYQDIPPSLRIYTSQLEESGMVFWSDMAVVNLPLAYNSQNTAIDQDVPMDAVGGGSFRVCAVAPSLTYNMCKIKFYKIKHINDSR